MNKMMARKRQSEEDPAVASVGYAADDRGVGIAYVSLAGLVNAKPLRVPFTVRRHRALRGREVGYAALAAVAERLLQSHDGPVRLVVDDEALVADLNERRPLPGALTIPYVALRCRLNRFAAAAIVRASSRAIADLRARALAEVSLHVAA